MTVRKATRIESERGRTVFILQRSPASRGLSTHYEGHLSGSKRGAVVPWKLAAFVVCGLPTGSRRERGSKKLPKSQALAVSSVLNPNSMSAQYLRSLTILGRVF